MRETVGFQGDGSRLAERVATLLGSRFDLVPPAECTIIVTVAATAAADWDDDVRKSSATWLPVYVEYDRVIIGPYGGCPTCARTRRRRASPDAPRRNTLWQRHGDKLDRFPSPLCTSAAEDVTAAIVTDELTRGCSPDTFRKVGLRSLAISRHRFLPDPACPDCGGLPADSAELARIELAERLKPEPAEFRTRRLSTMHSMLRETYVDEVAGVVRSTVVHHAAPIPRAVAPLSSTRDNDSHDGWGRTFDTVSSKSVAVLESLERAAGEEPGGKRTVVHGSYRELADHAVDPKTFGLYPPERYDTPDFPFLRYHDDLPFSWVWGYSFGRGEPVLVPERYAYYALHSQKDPRFVYEVSNGCALGNSVEEATLSGLLEIIERDALLMTWYARLRVPRLAPESAGDPVIPLMIERIRHEFDYDVLLFDTTLEFGVPSFWGMAVDRSPDPARPRAFCAGGADLVPQSAVLKMMHELTHLLELVNYYDSEKQQRAARMAAEPHNVKQMDDHPLLYSHESTFDRLGFLLTDQQPRRFSERQWHWPRHDDLSLDLAELVGRLAAEGLDVITVDQTTPDQRAGGLSCVKVIVPGSLPITFGHANRRLDGLPRLLTVPQRLGHYDRPLTMADLNPHPHPFP